MGSTYWVYFSPVDRNIFLSFLFVHHSRSTHLTITDVQKLSWFRYLTFWIKFYFRKWWLNYNTKWFPVTIFLITNWSISWPSTNRNFHVFEPLTLSLEVVYKRCTVIHSTKFKTKRHFGGHDTPKQRTIDPQNRASGDGFKNGSMYQIMEDPIKHGTKRLLIQSTWKHGKFWAKMWLKLMFQS